MDKFAFNPVTGFLDSAAYPNPNSEAETREQLFSLHEQTRDYINEHLNDAVTSDTVVKLKANETGFSYSTDGETYIVLPGSGSGQGDMFTSVYDTNASGVVDNAEKVNGHTVQTDVPANAVFTDTVYDDSAVQQTLYGDFTKIGDSVDPNGGTKTLPNTYNEFLFIIDGEYSSSNKFTEFAIIPRKALEIFAQLAKPGIKLASYTAKGSSASSYRVSFTVTKDASQNYVVVFARTQDTYKVNSVEVYGR